MTADGARDPIRVAVVDDHPVVREGTAAILAGVPGLRVTGQGATVDDARALALSGDTDVLVLDIRLAGDSGLRLLGELRDRKAASVVLLTSFAYPQYVEAALRGGASGYVLKTAPISELVEAITKAAEGGMAFGIRPGPGSSQLPSPRELDVIRLVIEGRSNDEIGVALGIGSKTVETHLHRLYERFGLVSRAELTARALREGWLEVPSR